MSLKSTHKKCDSLSIYYWRNLLMVSSIKKEQFLNLVTALKICDLDEEKVNHLNQV